MRLIVIAHRIREHPKPQNKAALPSDEDCIKDAGLSL